MVVVATVALLGGCAQPGSAPGIARSAAVDGAAPSAGQGLPDAVSCARDAAPTPYSDPSSSFDVSDPEQRARRALEAQRKPTPRRAGVPETAVAGAESCVQFLMRHFTLLTTGFRSVPDESAIDTALRSAGLEQVVVGAGPAFAASTGAACVYGTFTGSGLDFAIGPRAADGSCP
ncbi:hypothetical protein ACQPZX_38180 [Actinoplanes sp. CA-142083]|uniref:hypothetical protein n=1 Tax=Actinoplanes sp. CA-142083 TaxID=3239903 RepID=UPI003D93A0C0